MNSIIIDSSDDEEPTPKRAKLENSVESIKITEVKSLLEKDIVVIEDEEEKEVVPLREKKDIFEEIKSKLLNKDLTIKKVEKNTAPLSASNISNDIVIIGTNTNKELIKIDNIRKRAQLIPVKNDNYETNEKFAENNIENLLEHSTSNNLNVEIQENVASSTNAEKGNEMIEEFKSFLDACRNCKCEDKYKQLIVQKLPKLEEKYNAADRLYIKSNLFKTILLDNVSRIKRKPSDVILFFSEVYKELGGQKRLTIELTEKENRNLEKLQNMLNKINKTINQLEMSECHMEEESDSEYLKLDRYKTRAALVYEKICGYTRDDPYASRQIYKRLDISCSKYSQLNRAIDKLYNKTKQFPSYYDVDRCVRKCVEQNNLDIKGSELTFEINKIFEYVGELLKRRRRLETYETINAFVDLTEQEDDPEFEAFMDKRHIENQKRIDDFLEKYSMYQEQGKDPAISSDSDDSCHDSETSTDE